MIADLVASMRDTRPRGDVSGGRRAPAVARVGQRPRRVVGAVVLVVLLCAGLFAAPAHATARDYPPIPVTVDGFKITHAQVDFGNGNLGATGRPTADGYLVWMQDPDDGRWWPSLEGRLFINNSAGLCARMVIEYRQGLNTVIAQRRGGTVCAPDDALHSWRVDLMPFGHEDVNWVVVRIESVTNDGVSTVLAESNLLSQDLP